MRPTKFSAALVAQNPRISFAEIARELDLSYEYITLICRKEGISVMRANRGRPRGRSKGWREAA